MARRACTVALAMCFAWSVAFAFPPRHVRLASSVLLAPEIAKAAAPTQLDSSGVGQVALIGALLFFSVAVFTFAKPEQEEWQREIDEVMTEEEWKRSDGPSMCQKCGCLCVNGYCPRCTRYGL